MRILTKILTFSLLVLVAACGSRGVNPGTDFSESAAYVLIKTSSQEHRSLMFRGFDEGPHHLIPHVGYSIQHRHGFALLEDGNLSSRAPDNSARYHLIVFEPGDYVMASIEDNISHHKFCFSGGTHVFSPVQGEVLVLGSYDIDDPLASEDGELSSNITHVFGATLRVEEAEEILQAFGNTSSEVRYYQRRNTYFENGRSALGGHDVCGGFYD